MPVLIDPPRQYDVYSSMPRKSMFDSLCKWMHLGRHKKDAVELWGPNYAPLAGPRAAKMKPLAQWEHGRKHAHPTPFPPAAPTHNPNRRTEQPAQTDEPWNRPARPFDTNRDTSTRRRDNQRVHKRSDKPIPVPANPPYLQHPYPHPSHNVPPAMYTAPNPQFFNVPDPRYHQAGYAAQPPAPGMYVPPQGHAMPPYQHWPAPNTMNRSASRPQAQQTERGRPTQRHQMPPDTRARSLSNPQRQPAQTGGEAQRLMYPAPGPDPRGRSSSSHRYPVQPGAPVTPYTGAPITLHTDPRLLAQEFSRPRRPSGPQHSQHLPYALLPMLIPSTTSFPSLDWNVFFPIQNAYQWVGYEQRGQVNLQELAVLPPVKKLYIHPSKLKIGPMQFIVNEWGPIRVKAMEYLTVGHILKAIQRYFDTPLTQEEIDALPNMHISTMQQWVLQSFAERKEKAGKLVQGDRWPALKHSVPSRGDFLFGSTHYAGLQMDEKFAESKELYLTLEDPKVTRGAV